MPLTIIYLHCFSSEIYRSSTDAIVIWKVIVTYEKSVEGCVRREEDEMPFSQTPAQNQNTKYLSTVFELNVAKESVGVDAKHSSSAQQIHEPL